MECVIAAQHTVAPGAPFPADWPTEDELDHEIAKWTEGREILERGESQRRGPLEMYDEGGHNHIADRYQRWCWITVAD